MEKIEANALPEIRHELVAWTRSTAPWFWLESHLQGSKFYLPPDLRHLDLPVAFKSLAKRYAEHLERSRLYVVTPEMTFLALKTTMPNYQLMPDMLPSPNGFITWQAPIGAAERTQQMQIRTDPLTGDVLSASLHDWVSGITDDDVPIVAATWELSEDMSEVLVVWYTRPQDIYTKGLNVTQTNRVRGMLPPLAFEREQILPIGQKLDWFTSAEEPRLRLTVQVDIDKVPTSLREDAIARSNNILPDLDQLTKTLVATWLLMGMRFVKKDVELPDRPSRKRLARAGVPEAQVNAGVQVIRMGGPLRTHKPAEGDPAYRWKKRRIVGPFVRSQWYPSTGEHKSKLIEPYIAGPEGAPIGNVEKVYLLG